MRRTSLSVSVRRHFIDHFFFAHVESFIDKKIIDIGGKKTNKRGFFDINKLTSDVTYVNIEERDKPDVLADAAQIPLPGQSFDVAILAEVLEHVPEPVSVMKEVYRLLQTGGKLFITVPFMYPVHADPFDYGRYTDYFWQENAEKIGFSNIKIDKQGGIFAVAGLMIQHIFRSKKISWSPIQTPLVKLCMWLDRKTKSPLLRAWTTGYGIVLTK